jgi:ferric-dicitrate binding protein FerR (iron transport regulator)
MSRLSIKLFGPLLVATITVIAFGGVLALAQVKVKPKPDLGFLDRLEGRLERDLDVARADQANNKKTLDDARALLSRAQASKSPAAVSGAERAVSLAEQALQKNKLREQRVLRAIGWVQKLKESAAAVGPIGAFMPRAEGTVEVEPKGGGPARKLAGDVPPVAGPGDTVKTGADGRADLLLPNGSTLNLDAASAVTLLDDGLNLLFGQIRAKVQHVMGQRFDVRTPTAICGVRGTDFIVREKAGKPASLVVIEGQVAFSDIKGIKTVLVNAGQQSYLLPDGTPAEPTRANIHDMPKWWEEQP